MKKIALVMCTILFSMIFVQLINNSVEGLTVGVNVDTNIIPPPPLPILDARDDTATTNEDTPVRINVLSNDNYIGVARVTSVTTPSHGTTVINADNTVRYTPNRNFAGSDSFTYTISDGTGLLTDTARVSITIKAVNDVPVANDDAAETDEDTSVTIDVTSNDTDPDGDTLTVDSVSIQPENGAAVINPDNTITYTPNQNFAGSDSFDYTVSDGKGGTDTATVSVTVIETIPTPSIFSINQLSSGLVSFDPLNNETQTKDQLLADQSYWNYGGSADTLNPPAPRDLFKDSEGLHIGVQTPANGTYAGYYAVTPPTDAKLFHSVITTPVSVIDGEFFQNGAYVQAGPQDGRINYVTCVSITSTAGTSWHIVRTFGNFDQATDFEVLWSDFSANQPLTRDCTIITNGNNYLKIYLDGIKIYESNTLDLQMPGPFLYFLEPQNSHAQMLYGIYRDFYITSDENIKVTNVPATATRVDMVDTSGSVLASASVTDGTAILDVGKHHFPLAANIKVYDIANIEIASTSSPASIFGGDVYSVNQ